MKTEVVHRGRLKVMNERKLSRLFTHHTKWNHNTKFGPFYAMHTFQRGKNVRVFMMRGMP